MKIIAVIFILLLVGSYPLLGQQFADTPLKGLYTLVSGGHIPSADSLISITSGVDLAYIEVVGLDGWPNATKYYESVTEIRNNDTVPHTIELSFNSWSGTTSGVKNIRVKIFNGSNVQQGTTIEIGTGAGSTGKILMPVEVKWRVQWEILWKAEASDKDAVDVTLMLRVIS